jgi:hypothetical protein
LPRRQGSERSTPVQVARSIVVSPHPSPRITQIEGLPGVRPGDFEFGAMSDEMAWR